MCEDLAIYQGIKNHKSKRALGIFAMRVIGIYYLEMAIKLTILILQKS